MGTIQVVVSGALGRMGRTVCAAVSAEPDLVLAGGADPGVSADPGGVGAVPGLPFCAPDLDEALAAVEKAAEQTAAAPADGYGRVVVDFTRPDSVVSNVLVCLRRGWPAVVGTTGLDAEAFALIAEESERTGTPGVGRPQLRHRGCADDGVRPSGGAAPGRV